MTTKAIELEGKFTQLFTKFGKHHTVYNAVKIFESSIVLVSALHMH